MPPETLDLSLNEVETTAQKAARGAGLPWGIAEDTGRSAVWLARHVGAWAQGLLALLETPPPNDESPLWLAGLLADGGIASAERIVRPLWLLPVLLAGPGRHQSVSLRLTDAEIRCNPGEAPSATRPAEALADLPAGPVAVCVGGARLAPLAHDLRARLGRSVVAASVWDRLQALAVRTYVPASEESRLRGAGAGLLDDE